MVIQICTEHTLVQDMGTHTVCTVPLSVRLYWYPEHSEFWSLSSTIQLLYNYQLNPFTYSTYIQLKYGI